MCCRHKEYTDRVPEDSEAFMEGLAAFYAEHETDLPKPVVRCATCQTLGNCTRPLLKGMFSAVR